MQVELPDRVGNRPATTAHSLTTPMAFSKSTYRMLWIQPCTMPHHFKDVRGLPAHKFFAYSLKIDQESLKGGWGDPKRVACLGCEDSSGDCDHDWQVHQRPQRDGHLHNTPRHACHMPQ